MQTVGDIDEPHENWHQHDYLGDDHEERAEQALLDRQIRLDRDRERQLGEHVARAGVGATQHVDDIMKKPQQAAEHDPLLHRDAHEADADREVENQKVDQVRAHLCDVI